MNKRQLFFIIGLGSIGKHHAVYFSNLPGDLIFIDPDEKTFSWAKENIKKDFKYYKNISLVSGEFNLNDFSCIAVISNWGNLHYSSLIELKDLGVKNFFIEKPIVNSLKKIDDLLHLVKNDNLKFIAGFGWRHSGLHEKIKDIANLHLGGSPQSIIMTGGAFGIVTNGIHFLDLAISIFNEDPITVFSNLKSDNINPRSKDLDFWQGVSSWSFSNDKTLTICSSNHSSVAFTINIFCPKGKIIIEEGMASVSVYKRDAAEIKNDPRIIRLGNAFKQKSLGFSPDYSSAFDNLISPLLDFDDDVIVDANRESIATKAIIYALISSKLGRHLKMDEKIDQSYYEKEWMIS